MPKGPKGEHRPADVVGAAVRVAKIATGEEADDKHEVSGRVRSGRAGGEARAKKLTGNERTAIAKRAAAARWGNSNSRDKERSSKMTTQTEQAKLVERFHKMTAEDGLRDMKFFFGQVAEATVDEFCGEVNRLYTLVEEGKFTKIESWGDGKGLPES